MCSAIRIHEYGNTYTDYFFIVYCFIMHLNIDQLFTLTLRQCSSIKIQSLCLYVTSGKLWWPTLWFMNSINQELNSIWKTKTTCYINFYQMNMIILSFRAEILYCLFLLVVMFKWRNRAKTLSIKCMEIYMLYFSWSFSKNNIFIWIG